MNGLHTGTQPAAPPESYGDMQSAVIKVNFGLSWKHIAALVLGTPAFVGSIAGAGWLVMPAKQSDLKQLEQQVTGISHQMNGLQEVSVKLTTAVDELARTVARIRPQPAVAVPRRRPRNAAD